MNGDHNWAVDRTEDGDVLICDDCGKRKGSRGALRPCPATYIPGPSAEQKRDDQVAHDLHDPSKCRFCEPPEQP